MKVKIEIHGCDDSTKFSMEVTQQEFEFLETISKKSVEASEYQCQPILEIVL